MLTWHFFLTALIIVLLPGTGVLFTVATGLRQGRRASLLAALGCTAGIIPHLLATLLGLAALLHVCALAFQLVKWAGAAYLVYLAWGLWRDTGSLAADPETPSRPGGIVLKAFLINILNPKLSIHGVVLTMFDARNNLAMQVVADVPVAGPVPPPSNVVTPADIASSICCGQMKWMCESMPPAVTMQPSPAITSVPAPTIIGFFFFVAGSG